MHSVLATSHGIAGHVSPTRLAYNAMIVFTRVIMMDMKSYFIGLLLVVVSIIVVVENIGSNLQKV